MDICTFTAEGKVAHPKDLLSCRFYDDGTSILTGGIDGAIRKINTVELKMLRVFSDEEIETNPSPVTAIKFVPKSQDTFLSTYARGVIKIWKDDGKCLKTLIEDNQILGLGLCPLDNKFATTTDACKIHLYDISRLQKIRSFEGSYKRDISDGHSSRVFTVCFHPKSTHEFISGGWDNTIQYWDTRRETAVRYIHGPHICGEGLDIDSTGAKIISCGFSKERNLLLWDYYNMKLISDLTQDSVKYYCGMFLANKFIIASGSNPSTITVVNTKDNTATATYRTPYKGCYALHYHQPKTPANKGVINIKVATVASHMLIKLKFMFRPKDSFTELI